MRHHNSPPTWDEKLAFWMSAAVFGGGALISVIWVIWSVVEYGVMWGISG